MTKSSSSSLRSPPRPPPSLSAPQQKRRRMNDSMPTSYSPFQPTRSRHQPPVSSSSNTLPSPHELHYQLSQNLSAVSKRYQTALAHDPHSIQPVLYPADTFFARPTLICVVCNISFPSHEHLVHHIQQSHNTGYNPAPSLSTPFSTPAVTTTTPPVSTTRPYSDFLPTQLPPLQPTDPFPAVQPPPLPALATPPVFSSYQQLSMPAASAPAVPPIPSANIEDDAASRKSKFYCDVCQVSCDTNAILQVHFGGKPHRKRAEREAALRNAMTRLTHEQIIKLPNRTYICNLCKTDIDSDNSLLQHLESVKHKKNVAAKNQNVSAPHVSPSQAYKNSPSRNLSASQSPGVSVLLQKRGRVASPLYASQNTVPNPPLNLLSADLFNPSNSQLPPLSNQLQTTPALPSIDQYQISPSRVAPKLLPLVNLSDSAPFAPSLASPATAAVSSTPSSNFTCDVCSVTCNSQDSFNSHLASAKHKRKQAAFSSTGQTPPTGDHRCDICNISCYGDINFQAHLRGKMHAKKLKALNVTSVS